MGCSLGESWSRNTRTRTGTLAPPEEIGGIQKPEFRSQEEEGRSKSHFQLPIADCRRRRRRRKEEEGRKGECKMENEEETRQQARDKAGRGTARPPCSRTVAAGREPRPTAYGETPAVAAGTRRLGPLRVRTPALRWQNACHHACGGQGTARPTLRRKPDNETRTARTECVLPANKNPDIGCRGVEMSAISRLRLRGLWRHCARRTAEAA